MERSIAEKRRIGIFGGTFDPPHIGHQILAMEAYDELKLDKLFWVLAPEPPHKIGKTITPTHIRIEMVRAAIQYDEIFELSFVDIDRKGPHFVLDTLKIFRQLFPIDILIFLIGGDSLHDLPNWHQPKEFINACDNLGVMHRPGEKIDLVELEKYRAFHKKLNLLRRLYWKFHPIRSEHWLRLVNHFNIIYRMRFTI